MSKKINYKVTAIVSVYKAEEFLRACLEDLVQQSIFAQIEVIIIDACSPENEQAIALEYIKKYSNIIYIRTGKRETLYASWNRGIKMARGKYITNANADDRHAPNALERMAHELDTHPDVALVYAKSRITNQKNALFETATIKKQLHWFTHDHLNLMRQCEVGAQPMWRKSVHDELGYFNEDFIVAGDYDMWLRISEKYPLRHINEDLGLVLFYDNNLEGQNPIRSYDETYLCKKTALTKFMQPSFTSHIPFDSQFRLHHAKIAHILKNIQQGKEFNDSLKLDYEFYAYGALSARMGQISNAIEVLNIFFSLVKESRNICDLYRFLLLTSQGELAGHLRHEQASHDEKPVINIIISLHNQAKYLEDALVSVLSQSQTNFNVTIIHDDFCDISKVNLENLLYKYNDFRISIMQSKHKTLGAALNQAISMQQAPFVCVLDANDMLSPNYIKNALTDLKNHTDSAWIYPKTLMLGMENHIILKDLDYIFNSLEQRPCPMSGVYKKSMWEKLGGYTESNHGINKDFWLKAKQAGFLGHCTQAVEFIYRYMFKRNEDIMH